MRRSYCLCSRETGIRPVDVLLSYSRSARSGRWYRSVVGSVVHECVDIAIAGTVGTGSVFGIHRPIPCELWICHGFAISPDDASQGKIHAVGSDFLLEHSSCVLPGHVCIWNLSGRCHCRGLLLRGSRRNFRRCSIFALGGNGKALDRL